MAFLAATMLHPARSGSLFGGQGGVGRMGAGPEVGVGSSFIAWVGGRKRVVAFSPYRVFDCVDGRIELR